MSRIEMELSLRIMAGDVVVGKVAFTRHHQSVLSVRGFAHSYWKGVHEGLLGMAVRFARQDIAAFHPQRVGIIPKAPLTDLRRGFP